MCGRKVCQAALCGIFLITLSFFFFGTLFSPKAEVSKQEKRQLVPFPTIALSKKAISKFPESLNDYLKDHLFYREDMVYLNALMRVYLFRHSPTFLVLAGKEGWYFYMGDWALHDYLKNKEKNEPALIRSWEELIALRQKRMQSLGANYLALGVPNKECVYQEYLPDRFDGQAGTTMLDALEAQMAQSSAADHFLDLQGPLSKAKPTGRLYYKTDSHWNDRGAFVAYLAIMDRLQQWYPQAAALAESNFYRQDGPMKGGDLALLMGLTGAIKEEDEVWNPKQSCAPLVDRKVRSSALPEGQILEANGCPTGLPLRVLLISDSFGQGLRKYLSNTFQEVIYSREVPFPDLLAYMEQYHPDIVMDLRVGRYLPKMLFKGENELDTGP
jgi:hypothetical protein